jgi:hypothetical protein
MKDGGQLTSFCFQLMRSNEFNRVLLDSMLEQVSGSPAVPAEA